MQRLVYNLTGQTLSHVPDVRRASATWVLEDLLRSVGDSARELDSGSVNVDAATEATTAIAGPGQADPRSMTVASTAGFVVGVTYEIVSANADGDRENLVLAGTPSGALLAEQPLIGTYPTGSTIRGVTLTTAAIDAAVLQDEQRVQGDWPMRIVWTYPDGSRAQEAVRLVREDRSDQLAASVIAEVRTLFPDVSNRMQRHGRDTLGPFVRSQIRQFRADLLGRNIRAEELLTGEKGLWTLVWRTLLHLAQLGNAPRAEDSAGILGTSAGSWLTYCKDNYDKHWHALTIGPGGPEMVAVEPVSSTAPASSDDTYRRVIMEL